MSDHRRPHRYRVRRLVLNLALTFVVAAIAVGNLPDSALKSTLGTVTQPFLVATGLQQNWNVFSQPRTISAYVDAHVDYSDGSSATVTIPNDGGLRAYRDYRWQKYMEVIRPDSGAWLWPTYARYIADRERADGRNPLRVTLVRRWADTLPPGPGPERGPWQKSTMAVLDVGAP